MNVLNIVQIKTTTFDTKKRFRKINLDSLVNFLNYEFGVGDGSGGNEGRRKDKEET